MKAFLALAKVNFLSLLLSTIGGSSKKKQRSGWAALLLLAFLMLVISGNYSLLLAGILAPMGGLDIMLMVMVLVGLCFCTFLTLYLSQSLLFSAKDIDLVLSLPVSSFSVLLARLMALYLEILFMMEIFLIPCGVAWLVNGGQGGAGFMVLLLLSGIFLSFIPAFFSLLFGSLIGLLISKIRFKNLFNTLFSIVLMLVVFVFAFGGTDYLEKLNPTNIESLRAMLVGSLPPLAWLVQAVSGPSLLLFLLTAVLCVVPFFLFSLLISRFYKKILTNLLNQHVRNDFKLGRSKASSSFSALLGKEARRFFGTPAYVLNCGIGLIFMLMGAGALFFFRGNIQEFLSLFTASPELSSLAIASYLPPLLLACCLFFLTMFLPSTVSISLEGKQLWILKEAPISATTIFLAKAGFPFLAGGAACTVALFVAGFSLALPLLSTLLVWLVSLSFLALSALSGLVVNLKHPRLDAENDTIVIKQSGSTLLGILFAFLECLLLAGLYFLLTIVFGLGFNTFSLLSIVLLCAASWLFYSWLKTRGSILFLQL